MMEIIQAIVLGVVQGLTEFLPVSSSGHLVIVEELFGGNATGEESLLMVVVLHAATAIATLVVFRKEVGEILKGLFQFKWNEETRYSLMIVLSMIPAVGVGLFMEDQVNALFDKPYLLLLVAGSLAVTAALLYFADVAKDYKKPLTFPKAFMVGIAQAIAILPGISRSGATISTSLLLGMDREKAARFSFLMVVPLILGAMAKDLMDNPLISETANPVALIAGFAAAFFTGVFACTWMIKLVKNSQLRYFSIYCIFAALFAAALYFFG